MPQVVINRKHGGFSLSDKALEWLHDAHGWQITEWEDGGYADDDARIVDNGTDPDGHLKTLNGRYSLALPRRDPELRSDPELVEAVRVLGVDAGGDHAELEIVEIPDGVEWEIDEYDGLEWVAETHRTWP